MAKTNIYFQHISESIGRVRQEIRGHYDTIDKLSEKASEQLEQIASTYLPAAAETQAALVKQAARSEAEVSAEAADRAIQFEFDAVEETLANYVRVKIPTEVTDCIGMLRTSNTALSAAEIRILSETVRGCYFGEKALSEYAAEHNVNYPFIPVAELQRDIVMARKECTNMINSYPGVLEGAKPLAPWISQSDNLIMQGNSYTFLEKEDSILARLEAKLRQATDITLSVFTNEDTKGIARLFEGAADEAEQTQRMIDLLISRPDLEPALSVFDGDLYANAKRRITEDKLAEAAAAKTAVAEALKAAQAANTAARAAKTAETERKLREQEQLRRTAAAQGNNNGLR